MKKIINLTIWFFLIPVLTFAQDTYALIAPLGSHTTVNVEDFDSYIGRLFIIFIVIAATIGVIRLMICGIQYMISEAVPAKQNAKSCMAYVIGGLLLILLSYIILATINPALTGVNFNDLRNRLSCAADIKSQACTGSGGGSPQDPDGGGSPQDPDGGGSPQTTPDPPPPATYCYSYTRVFPPRTTQSYCGSQSACEADYTRRTSETGRNRIVANSSCAES